MITVTTLQVRDSKADEEPDDTLIDIADIPDTTCITQIWDH